MSVGDLLPYALLVGGLVAFVHAAWLASRTRRFVREARRTDGCILGYTEKIEDDIVSDSSTGSGMSTEKVTAYYPQVKFTTAAGADVVFESRHRREHRGVGIAVRVLYDPADPKGTAEIEGGLNQWLPVVLAAVPAAGLLAGGVMMLLERR